MAELKQKEIHFYAYDPEEEVKECIHSFFEAERRIRKNCGEIHTTQLALMTGRLFVMGYRVFMHEAADDFYEITLGKDNTRTDMEIRLGHDILKLWMIGGFHTDFKTMEGDE